MIYHQLSVCPVLGKHFAHARFYDGANGRMLALDPVKRDLNGYRYCDGDPVKRVDPDGEFWNIVAGAGFSGVFGGIGGFVSSAVSQKLSGEKVDWKKAHGSAANGFIVGAVQGGLLASGAGIPVALASSFMAGTAGSAAEQYISEGKIDAGKSITSGLTNAVSNAIYGTQPLMSVGGAFLRGAGAGAATAGINYISDFIRQNPGYGGIDAGLLAKMAGRLVSPYGLLRDPRKGCGSFSPFAKILGYDSAKGFQYGLPRTDGLREQKKKFDLGEFFGATIFGGVVGGVTSAGFYGAGKGIERLKDGFRAGKDGMEVMPDPYDGVKKSSEYLQSQGVPRKYRKQALESFDIKSIKLQTAGNSTYGLRFYGGKAEAKGRYLFETFSPLINRQNLALPYEWNGMTGIQQFQVKNGTIMITGSVAAQSNFGSQYVGGAKQWYINN